MYAMDATNHAKIVHDDIKQARQKAQNKDNKIVKEEKKNTKYMNIKRSSKKLPESVPSRLITHVTPFYHV